MKHFLHLIVFSICIASCSPKEPADSSLHKNHSVEVTYQTKKLNDSLVLLIRNEHVYLEEKLIKSFSRTDTLPAPGDTTQWVEDEVGERWAKLPKEYEFFVTVK
ncbi:MAG: hypothetical protein Q8928_15880 [Bacteroidota bacterium]|nr:hypothetical protein [Bacteroidota bacterium]